MLRSTVSATRGLSVIAMRATGGRALATTTELAASAGAGVGGSFDKMVLESLNMAGISGKAATDELNKLKASQILTLDLLKNMNHHDWEKSNLSVGAARAIQNGLWLHKQNEAMKKVELRRENSTKAEAKNRRL